MSVYKLTQDDTLPPFSCVLTEDDGLTPVNLTNFQVEFIIRYPTPLVKVANIPYGYDGAFHVLWAEGDLLPGEWPYSLRITSPSGVVTINEDEEGERLYLEVETKPG